MTTIVLLILTAILWGATPILEKIGLGPLQGGIKPLTAVAVRSFAISIILLIILFFNGGYKDLLQLDRRTIIIFTASGVLAGLLGMWTYFGALQREAASKVLPIAAAYPLVAALLAVIILREKVTWLRLLGTVFIIFGIWLVK